MQSSVREKFVVRLLEGVGKLTTGDPLDEATDVGPMISEDAARRAELWIAEAVSAGATVRTGGKRAGRGTESDSADGDETCDEGELPGSVCAGGGGGSVRRFRGRDTDGERFGVWVAGGGIYGEQ